MLEKVRLRFCSPFPRQPCLSLPLLLTTVSPPQIGITVTSTSEQVGVFALAYAVHKAASPIRFPPTVALTPLVARWMGKEVPKE